MRSRIDMVILLFFHGSRTRRAFEIGRRDIRCAYPEST